jgi:osmotically-inducible protein OsmY
MVIRLGALSPFPIVALAEARLHASPYHSLRTISCIYNDGHLVLRGCLSTFFQKQLAQTAVAHIKGVERVINQIEVRD